MHVDRIEALFHRYDANDDGLVDDRELEAFDRSHMACSYIASKKPGPKAR